MSESGNPWGEPGKVGPTVPGEPWFAPQPLGYPPGYTPTAGGGCVAWEDKSLGLFARWWGTFKEVSFNAKRFHAASAQSDDPWPAITFSVVSNAIGGFGGGLFTALIYLAIGGLGALSAARTSSSGGMSSSTVAGVFGIVAGMGVALVVALPLVMMLVGFLAPWIMGGIQHLALAMVGGATRPYSTTVRIVAYSGGCAAWYCVPLMGGTIAFGLSVVAEVLGFEEAHKCGSGKAMFAAIFPFALICICYCGCYALLGIFGVMSGFR